MSSNKRGVQARLQDAAMELFHERGYDRTTAAEIARRAGVTERTFFRYFPDKREVLFGGEATMRTKLTVEIAGAPIELGPLDTLSLAFRSLQSMHEEKEEYLKHRHEIISTTPALHERELAKLAALTDGLADALKERGVADLAAALAARTGMAVFVQAVLSWLDDPAVALGERFDLTFHELRMLLRERAPDASREGTPK